MFDKLVEIDVLRVLRVVQAIETTIDAVIMIDATVIARATEADVIDQKTENVTAPETETAIATDQETEIAPGTETGHREIGTDRDRDHETDLVPGKTSTREGNNLINFLFLNELSFETFLLVLSRRKSEDDEHKSSSKSHKRSKKSSRKDRDSTEKEIKTESVEAASGEAKKE